MEEVQARNRQRSGLGMSVWKLLQKLSRLASFRIVRVETIARAALVDSTIAQRIKQVVEDWRLQAVELEKERALVADMEKKLSSRRHSLRHLTQRLETECEVNRILHEKFCRSRYELIQNEHKYILSAKKMQQKLDEMNLELKDCTKDREVLQFEVEKGRRHCKNLQRELRKCRHSLTELKIERQQQMEIDERGYACKKHGQEKHHALKRPREENEEQNAERTKGRDFSVSQERKINTKPLQPSPADKKVTKAASEQCHEHS